MAVIITLQCDGCFAETNGHQMPRREFRSFDGKGWGFGVWHEPTIDDTPFPDGWVRSDPYTGCTYCPKCWQSIISDAADDAEDIAS